MLKSYVVNKLTFQRTIRIGAPLFQHRCGAKTFVLCKYTRSIDNVALLYQLAKYLQALHIETIEDFQRFESREILEIVVRAVNGLGDAGVNYLFMLAGDPNRCKPDVHIHHCIRDALGYDVSNEECQELFTEATLLLSNKYPYLTVRGLDGVVWRNYQIGNRR